MIPLLALAAGLILLVFFGARLRARAHTVVAFSSEGVELRRGSLPPGLIADLQALRLPQGHPPGRLEVLGQGETLTLRTRGLPDDFAQRVRNVTLLKRTQLRRP